MQAISPRAPVASPPWTLRLRARLRAAFYGGGTKLARRWALPMTPAERKTALQRANEAYNYHLEVLSNRPAARAIHRLEWQDLWTLPIFLSTAPRDVLRVARQQRLPRSSKVRPRDGFPYPGYYLHAFHHQYNGNLSRSAALTYEWQIRFLFQGASRLMRQAVIDALPKGDHLNILDVGCGTAAWVPQARLQGRQHAVTGIDLSPAYLDVARARGDARAQYAQHNAEQLPLLWTRRFDVVVCIWLYHEVPPAARMHIAHEMARVLRPNGRLLLMEAVQPLDVPEHPDAEALNHTFAQHFNEPHFMSYQALDMPKHLKQHGFELQHVQRCFASRLMLAQRLPD